MALLFLSGMEKQNYHVVGVMSGTSLDGIDLVEAKFYFENSWRFELLHCETVPYSKHWKKTLLSLVSMSSKDLATINDEYTTHLGTR